jgi:hypothetical protein
MSKIHTRTKRMRKCGTHLRGKLRPVNRKVGPKTFDTEEKAKKWAEFKGIKEYTLVNLKNEASSTKKIKVIH